MALDHGGLGRLTYCFGLNSNISPANTGYGLRYMDELFKQSISKARQEEMAKVWFEVVTAPHTFVYSFVYN